MCSACSVIIANGFVMSFVVVVVDVCVCVCGMIEYVCTIYTIYSSAAGAGAGAANCWIRSSNNALTSV